MTHYLFWEKTGVRMPRRFELNWSRWSVAFELIFTGHDGEDDDWPWMLHLHILFLNLFLHFPAPRLKENPKNFGEWLRWGFTFGDWTCVHFHWSAAVRIWEWPWAPVHQRHEVRRADGTWGEFVGSWERGHGSDGREVFFFPYTYKLKRGEVQHRTAEVYVERRSWRPRWFQWLTLFERSIQSISVTFDDEVGERTGSWKGGCIGCGYDLRSGESPEQCLRRMEQERIFD